MVEEGLPVFGYLHKDYWIDMGNREQYLQVHKDALDGKVSLKTDFNHNAQGLSIIPPVVIGRDCHIEPNAQIGPHVVLGNGCRVESRAVIENSVLWDGVSVGAHCTVQRSILGNGVNLPEKTEVADQSMVAG
jgi:NDP-sugar pyrophosphorylase family protein